MKEASSQRLSAGNEKLRKETLLFIFLIGLLMIVQFASLYIEKEMGAISADDWSIIIRTMLPGIVGFGVYLGLAICLLLTRSVTVARYIVAFVGVTFLYFVAQDVLNFNPVGLMIDGFILWRIYELYESV